LAAKVDAYLFTRIPGDDHRRRLNANEPPRGRRASDVAGGAPGLFPVTRGIRDVRDSKIEIVRAAALVLEPWVTAAPSNPAGPPSSLAPSTLGDALFFLSRRSNKYRRDVQSLSLSLSLGPAGIQSANFDVRRREREKLDRARIPDDLFPIRVDLIFMPTKEGKLDDGAKGRKEGRIREDWVSPCNHVLSGCCVSRERKISTRRVNPTENPPAFDRANVPDETVESPLGLWSKRRVCDVNREIERSFGLLSRIESRVSRSGPRTGELAPGMAAMRRDSPDLPRVPSQVPRDSTAGL